jgi:hypothetical protein
VNRLDARNNNRKSRQYNPSGRRWWLKLQFAFFFDKRVCALRRRHGDRALIIYQKIMLKSLENNSSMKYEGLEETFEEEIAVDIMEDNGDGVQLIREIMNFLIKHDLMVLQEDSSYFFPQAAEMSGDEGASAERMRQKRARDKESSQPNDCENSDVEPSHSDDSTSQGDALSQCDEASSQRYHIQNQNNRIDRSISKSRIDLDLDVDLKQESETEETDSAFVSAEHRAASASADAAAPPAAGLFSVEELSDFEYDHKIYITHSGLEAFHSEMQQSGWMLYGKPVTKAGIVKALRGWAKYHKEYEDVQYLDEQILEKAGEYIDDEEVESCQNEKAFYKLIIKHCPASEFDNRIREHIQRKSGFSDAVMRNWIKGE